MVCVYVVARKSADVRRKVAEHSTVYIALDIRIEKGTYLSMVSTDVQSVSANEASIESKSRRKRSYQIAKRIIDIVLSVIGLIISAVPMAVISLLIKIESPGPVIYIHNRIGKDGKPLPLLKFRSMYENADSMFEEFTSEQKLEWEKNFKLENDSRITRVGRVLRKTSLDELPQFVNILKGELSLVGPRPVVAEELERYGEDKAKFLSVTPGLTGYWQAYARSTCTYERRMEMELFYVENANFWWDIKIMFVTVGAVLHCRGAE